MKKTILITLMVMLTLTIGAQNAAQARKVLDRTAAVVSNKNGATAQFTLSSAKTGTVSGRLSLKGNKFQVTTPQSIIWYNGKTQWSYLKSTEEVNVSTPTAAQQLQMNPYRFINMYKTGYNLGLTDKGKAYWVHLTAQNPKNSVPEIYILIDKKTSHPETIKMRRGKEWTTVTVRNFKAGRLADSVFTFNAKEFPHAEVVDLR